MEKKDWIRYNEFSKSQENNKNNLKTISYLKSFKSYVILS